ncbi:hypothetical protein [Methylobacterium goesingense]|uniref:Uncharacterized protein n=1 Tax=Methylobacterium goesingense TaxID=243690 RepID=A0ABV2LBV1_9HYPH|nr:hypothetical protein [Methylobacterium goesingense]GJD73622.1 hypothetical protein CFIICLFH_1851 [Methylobacterium goesingense]
MKRTFAAFLAACTLTALSAPAFARDGGGNASNPERAVSNTGGVSGGPNHDAPRGAEAGVVDAGGKPNTTKKDRNTHGHSHDDK